MIKVKVYVSFICITICLLYGCYDGKTPAHSTIITVDVNDHLNFPLEKCKIIPLETSNVSLLYDIISIVQLENKYFVQTRDRVLAFDANGGYLYNISRVGQSGEEYIQLSSFFAKNNELYLYDGQQYRLLVFSPSGSYIRTEKNTDGHTFPIIYPIGKDKYIAKNIFNGTPGTKTPALSLLNKKGNMICELKGRFLQTGFLDYDFVNSDDDGNNVTYWETLNDTIYTVINDNEVFPKYVVDFGEYAISEAERYNKDIYDLIDYVNNTKNEKVALYVRYVYEEDGYVYFVFIAREEGNNDYSVRLALYNKESCRTITYVLPSDMNEKYKMTPFLKVTENQVIMALEDCKNIENNQSLFVIDKKELYEK